MNKLERQLLTDIRDGMVTLAAATTSLLKQAHPEAGKEVVAVAVAAVERAAEQVQIVMVAADGFSPVPDPIPQPAPPRPTPDDPAPAIPHLTEAEQEVGKVWRVNDTLMALGIQIKSGGAIEVSWEVFAKAIGKAQAGELSMILVGMYGD